MKDNVIYRKDIVRRVVKKLNADNEIVFLNGHHSCKYNMTIVKPVLDAFWFVVAEAIEDGKAVHYKDYIKIEPKYYAPRRIKVSGVVPVEEGAVSSEKYKLKYTMYNRLKNACEKLMEKQKGLNVCAEE